MNQHKAFSSQRCQERIQASFDRLKVLGGLLTEMGDAFGHHVSNTPSAESVEAISEELPRALLARSIAAEGIALVEQITWDICLFERDGEGSCSVQLADLKKLGTLVDPMGPKFEIVRETMTNMIERMKQFAESAGDCSEYLKKMEARPS